MQVTIPEIADNIQEAEILALLVSVGEHVRAAQPVLELETGKSSFELPSPAAGRIEQIYVGIGDDVKVGDVVLTLRTAADGGPRSATPVDAAPEPSEAGTAATLAATLATPSEAERGQGRRKLADAQLQQEWPRIPHVAIHDTLEITSLEAARRRYRDEHATTAKLSLTAFVIKACAIALRQHPRMNSSLIRHGRALAVKRFVHVGFAVYTEQGLVFPVIEHADRRSLQDIASDLEALTGAARAQTLAQAQLEGATFTVTNLRGFSGTTFTPIIDPPQVGALGLCRTRTEDGRIFLPVGLAYDQRVNDDAAAIAFSTTIAELLHDPLAMLLRC